MTIQWTTTSQAAVLNGAKILVYADSGLGKTLLTATLPAPLLISAESGLLSLSRANIERVFGVNTPGICYDIPVMAITTLEDLDAAYNWVATSPDAKQFQTIALDSLTEIAEVVLNKAKRSVKDPRQAYGDLLEKMQTVIRNFRDLPGRNVYMSAKMEAYKDEFSGSTKYGPMMPGSKLGPQLPYFFDEVFQLAINTDLASGQKYRYLRTQPDLQYNAKDRSGALQAQEVPHLGYVISKILGVNQ